jgi:hypothetical protein
MKGWPNGLALSRAALIDRQGSRADAMSQKRHDLGAALRRKRLRRVGPQAFLLPKKSIASGVRIQQTT